MNPLIQNFFHSILRAGAPLSESPEQTSPQVAQSPETASLRSSRKSTSISLERRISINQVTTLPWCLSQDLTDYQQSGFAAIGLSWRKMNEYGLRRSMRRVLESGLPVSSLGCVGGFTGENGYTAKDARSDARRMIRVAGQLRAGTVTVISGPQGGHIRSHANRLVVESLKELVPLAALYGVQLALQPMHPMFNRNWTFLHTLDETLTILDRVNDSRLKISFGTYHLWQESQLLDRVAELAPRIGLVRLADWGDTPRHDHDRLLPGTGRLPLAQVIRVLEDQNYTGWYELDVWSRDLWKQDRRDLMRACVQARDNLSSSLFPV
ncbi:sugar phosphate isomerase/epimerase family protein [Planctomicrobium sp. SH661]|uniref:sugar phosphate isomerase/epimerase family protein n=1 Tax=Planctomicrobium sp. SH661 TaxID=3448124 RepID=UPI003F5AE0A6